MILVDTSVWIDHFRRNNHVLSGLLETGRVWTHEFVIGELACGNLRKRSELLYLMGNLPAVSTVSHADALALIEERRLHGTGLGWVDVHLLGSALVEGLPLWTLDKTLTTASKRLAVAARTRDLE